MAIGNGTYGTPPKAFGKRVTAPVGGRSAPGRKPAPDMSPKAMAFLEAERAKKGQSVSSQAAVPGYLTPSFGSEGLTAGKPVWGRRVIATVIDTAVFVIPLILIIAAMGPQPEMTDEQFATGYFGTIAFLILASLAYAIGMEASTTQATLGKMAVGAIVADKTGGKPTLGAIIMRNTLGKLVSGMTPFYISYFIGLARRDRRCLHDLMAGTMVCAKAKSVVSYDQTFA